MAQKLGFEVKEDLGVSDKVIPLMTMEMCALQAHLITIKYWKSYHHLLETELSKSSHCSKHSMDSYIQDNEVKETSYSHFL